MRQGSLLITTYDLVIGTASISYMRGSTCCFWLSRLALS